MDGDWWVESEVIQNIEAIEYTQMMTSIYVRVDWGFFIAALCGICWEDGCWADERRGAILLLWPLGVYKCWLWEKQD